jgi:hypothetical protein
MERRNLRELPIRIPPGLKNLDAASGTSSPTTPSKGGVGGLGGLVEFSKEKVEVITTPPTPPTTLLGVFGGVVLAGWSGSSTSQPVIFPVVGSWRGFARTLRSAWPVLRSGLKRRHDELPSGARPFPSARI